MGFGELLGEAVRTALSRPQKDTYVVLDQHDRQHRVDAVDSQEALSQVINRNLFTVDGNRCRVVKIK